MGVQIRVDEPLGVGSGSIDAGEISAEHGQELAKAAKEHLVRVSPEAPSCCIDGRKCAECMDGGATEPRPSVAGGALITAYGAAELTGWFSSAAGSAEEKLAEVQAVLEGRDIVLGGHCDEKARANNFINEETGEPKTGCGADDALPAILTKLFTDTETVCALTQALLDRDYDAGLMAFERPEVKGWDPRKVLAITNAQQKGRGTEVLAGAHAEKLVVFNYVPDTTVDRDAFVADTGEQVFVVDMWYIDKLATALAAGRPDVEEIRGKIRHAMVAYQVATYLVLCNGTQRPAFLRQSDFELTA